MRPRTFLKTLWNSLSDISYYRELLSAPVVFSLRFFLTAMILLGLVVGSFTTARDLRYWNQALRRAQHELVERYPNDLVIAWDGTQLTSSEGLLELPYPSEFSGISNQYDLPSRLAVFDVETTERQHDALVVFSATTISLQADGQQSQEIALNSLLPEQAFQVTKDTIDELSAQVLETTLQSAMVPFAILSVALFVVSLLVSSLFIAAVESLLIFLLLSALGRKLSYSRVWQLALHALVFAQIVQHVAGTVFPSTAISWLSVSFWVIMTYILLSVQHEVRLK